MQNVNNAFKQLMIPELMNVEWSSTVGALLMEKNLVPKAQGGLNRSQANTGVPGCSEKQLGWDGCIVVVEWLPRFGRVVKPKFVLKWKNILMVQ